ncbi:vitamin K epoxide reductase family protein [Hippea maritima]|nr:vitamin K epoxide reductase family protein [Hippea maritima]
MKNLFKGIVAAGLLTTIIEISLRIFTNSSICHSQGCALVAKHVRYGEISILIIGCIFFFVLLVSSSIEEKNPKISNIIDLMLNAALAAEGFLVGYQLFRIHKICYFCFGIFITIVILSLLRLTQKKPQIWAGFASFLIVLGLTWMILPSQQIETIPLRNKALLYSNSCPHCEKIIKEIQQKNMKVKFLPIEKYAIILKSLGIDKIPVLIVKKKTKLEMIIGDKEIENYLKLNTKKEKNNYQTPFNYTLPSENACTIDKECK